MPTGNMWQHLRSDSRCGITVITLQSCLCPSCLLSTPHCVLPALAEDPCSQSSPPLQLGQYVVQQHNTFRLIHAAEFAPCRYRTALACCDAPKQRSFRVCVACNMTSACAGHVLCQATADKPVTSDDTNDAAPDISMLSPELQQQWHVDRNMHLGAIKIKPYSAIQAVWQCHKCPAGQPHIWSAPVYSRTRGSGCSYCSRLVCLHKLPCYCST